MRASLNYSLFTEPPKVGGKELQEMILAKLKEKHDSKAGNTTLIRELKLSEPDLPVYWDAVNALEDDGKIVRGRGKGGSIRIPKEDLSIGLIDKPKGKGRKSEGDLYGPIASTLKQWWVHQVGLREYIMEITAHQGRRHTGGFWITLGVTCHAYVPGRNLDITTFEIKKSPDEGIYGVFESAAHSAFAHRSFLLIQVPADDSLSDDENFERTKSECERFGLGLITFTDPSSWETYETIVDAEFKSPSHAQINKFIANQISEENRQRLLTMFR